MCRGRAKMDTGVLEGQLNKIADQERDFWKMLVEF